MRITDKQLDEYIAISERQGIKYKTRVEALDSAQSLLRLARVITKVDTEENYHKERLIKEI